MKITVRELKRLIRESVEECGYEEAALEEKKETEKEVEEKLQEADEVEEKLQEAVAAAFRAGYRRGRSRR